MACANARFGPVCERTDAHDGSREPHRNGSLVWHDPPVIFVDGRPYEPPTLEKPHDERTER